MRKSAFFILALHTGPDVNAADYVVKLFFLIIWCPFICLVFPYTTLFRSRGQKRFIYPPNTLKDAKISKTKIGWFVFAGFVYVANLYGVCLSARLLLAILGDERSGSGRAPPRGRPPVLARPGLLAPLDT